MKLYKVYKEGDRRYYDIKFILAINKKEAIKKYYELIVVEDVWDVKGEYICDRDDMVPTIEPIKEFNYER